MTLVDEIQQIYRERFDGDPEYIIRAPGRVNLIGEHTDYNDGYVMPMAIDRYTYIAFSPIEGGRVNAYLADFERFTSFDMNAPIQREKSPLEYVKGVTQALLNNNKDLVAWQGVVKGNVPIGAGLSSSASVTMAILHTYRTLQTFRMSRKDQALLGKWVENEWIGVNSGIMDQMAVAFGKKNKAVFIDCRSLKTSMVTLPKGTAVAILDTGTRRTLEGSDYNARARECAEAAAFFEVEKLRDVDMKTFEDRADDMDEIPRKRARHILTENERVLAAKDAAKDKDPEAFGKLMDESHVSMRDDFEISSDALNAMVQHAQAHDACYGARMTGGGFAGCAVALIKADDADAFAETVAAAYQKETGNTPQLYITPAVNGPEEVLSGK